MSEIEQDPPLITMDDMDKFSHRVINQYLIRDMILFAATKLRSELSRHDEQREGEHAKVSASQSVRAAEAEVIVLDGAAAKSYERVVAEAKPLRSADLIDLPDYAPPVAPAADDAAMRAAKEIAEHLLNKFGYRGAMDDSGWLAAIIRKHFADWSPPSVVEADPALDDARIFRVKSPDGQKHGYGVRWPSGKVSVLSNGEVQTWSSSLPRSFWVAENERCFADINHITHTAREREKAAEQEVASAESDRDQWKQRAESAEAERDRWRQRCEKLERAAGDPPIQPIVKDGGVLRFRENAIVRALLETSKLDLNNIAAMSFSIEDREQFNMLIGYSLSGFDELSDLRDETCERAKEVAALLAADGGSDGK